MKAILKPAAAPGFEIIETDRPAYGPDEVLIKVRLASICGTDIHITHWDPWSASRIHPPLIYGHEFCGDIAEVGENVTHLKPGDYVSAEMHIPCETCYQCMTGNRHICEHVKIAGVDLNGCFAEYVVLPKNQVIKLPETLSPEFGACLDSLGNAVHAVSRGEVSGKSVLINGCGPVGLFSVAVATALGATHVYAADISPYRLDLALKMGATEVFQADKVPIVETLLDRTSQRGVDVALELSGNPRAIRTAFSALARAGTMILFGIPESTVELDITNDIIFKEARVLGINGREMFRTWFLMLELLTSGRLDITPILTHRLPLTAFADAVALVESGQSGKILLTPS